MTKVKIRWNSERFLSLSAISISFITLLIFLYQTNLMRKQNYISILPYLMLSTTENSDGPVYELNLKNHGMGPAIMESVVLEYKGKRYGLGDYDNELFKFLSALAPELDSIKNASFSTLDRGVAIPANSTYNILSVSGSEEDYQLITRVLEQLLNEGLRYEITYRSILEERWLIHNDSQGPEKLN